MRALLALVLVCFACAGAAQTSVYRTVDADGNVTYSDVPTPGGEKVDVAPVQTFDPLRDPAAILERRQGKGDEDPDGPRYSDLSIVSPVPDESYRSNSGAVAVGIRVVPDLQELHTIQLFLDGRAVGGRDRSTARTLLDVGRGTHTLSAAVLDAKGREMLRSGSVTFHLLRAHR